MQQSNSIKDKIAELYESLPKQQKKVANYILANMNEVVFENITYLADQIDTSVATLVRFAHTLGYSGFPALREDLISYYKQQMNIADRFKRTMDNLPSGRPTYASITGSELDYLQQSIHHLDEESFNRAITEICAARKVYVFGNGSNECLANNLWFRLKRLGLEVTQLSQSGHCLVEMLYFIKPEDVIVIFDFFTPSLDTTRIHELVEKTETKIISITDTTNPLMLKSSSTVLYAKRGSAEYFNSHVVPTAIINALIIGIAYELGEKAVTTLKELSELRENYSYPPLKNSIKLEKHSRGKNKA